MNEDEARKTMVSARQAMREVHSHGLSWADFVADCGDRDEYRGSVVLDWLGY